MADTLTAERQRSARPRPLSPQAIAEVMTTGGDRRITLDPRTGLNQYMVAPRPSRAIAYSSSTANDISAPALAEIRRRLATLAPDLMMDGDGYAEALEALRGRLRTALALPTDTEIAFAASGTDLEYIGLSVAQRRDIRGIDTVLLGADEVGSGCALACVGAHYADRTPLGHAVARGDPIRADKAPVRLFTVSLRDKGSKPIPSEDILIEIAAIAQAAIDAGRHPLVHVVHGSKTGLILPSLAHIDALRRRFGQSISFVVDACQCRIAPAAIAAYLARGLTIFLTGSKFMGGPPFSGIALIPAAAARLSSGILPGLERIFLRAEWPDRWPGAASLPHGANLGLLLRLEAAIYELELFQRLTAADIRRTLDLFDAAVGMLTEQLGAPRLAPTTGDAAGLMPDRPLEMRTLVTLDLGQAARPIDFAGAGHIHRMLVQDLRRYACGTDNQAIAGQPIKLGQPVRCVTLADGTTGGTLRIGLSMPQMVAFAAMDGASLASRLDADMHAIATKMRIIGNL
ncbi:hypothetical protein [Sphingobium algorifonticola]|uniref:Aminotransferase class V-fold PLP-dependent enzyme n=1 Tax=Sphingobium algorifonticola TaxID=2008318 RepID=A0A437JCY8_9SPHN|nr:hypothetical protein [Sphingobium algorifonticola]RVT43751.1 hypothetical protein ENE74_03890 [Sphingobium algorifonticola]